jgi:predicted enzyme related to lactoylglutathione lyase
MNANAPRGRFVWYDLMTSDPSSAIDFYSKITGWGTTQWPNPQMPYTMWTVGEAPIGGVVKIEDEMLKNGVPPHWLAYVGVPDVDATAARATELGGAVLHPPTDIPEVGRFAVITDPQGAMIAIYSSTNPEPNAGDPQPGTFSWHELTSTDHAAGWSFYSELFGWEKAGDFDMGPPVGVYQLYGQGGKQYGGMWTKTPDMPMPPNWLYYVMVSDIDTAADQVKSLGGQVINGPMEVPGGDRIAQCIDPQGAMFALHARAAAS